MNYKESGVNIELADRLVEQISNSEQISNKIINDEKFSILDLNNITVRYPNSEENVIKNLSLTIESGKSIGIFGESGSGKSTLLDLILGLHIPINGDITMNKKSIKKNIKSWRKRVGYVSQDIQLIHDSILKNIAFGIDTNKIDFKKINKAIKEAKIDKFINSLSEGLDTVVGERGVRLSGGQKQRLAIARALYKSPDILIFDEASSALDVETEKKIMEEINFFKGQKTIIIVAHRLSTLYECDYVYELSNGSIVNSGSPKEILNSNKII